MKIVFVNDNNGEWEGIYVGGKLLREDHSLDPDDVLSVLGIEYETVWTDVDGRLPKNLSDVKRTDETT